LGLALPWRPWSPAPEPREVFWSGAEILGFPPATMGEAASADCSDMLDLLDARDAARLSSTSPSSDSNEIPRWCCARGPGSRPGVVWRETLLSFRNWSRKDIWEEGRSPSTARRGGFVGGCRFKQGATGGQVAQRDPPRKGFFVLQWLRKYHSCIDHGHRFLFTGHSILGFCLVSKYLTRLLDYCSVYLWLCLTKL